MSAVEINNNNTGNETSSATATKTHSPSPKKDSSSPGGGLSKVQQNGSPSTTTTTRNTQKGEKESINETTKNGIVAKTMGSVVPPGTPFASVPNAASKSMNVLRERSFIRPTNPQLMHPINAAIFMADPMHQKRRSFGHPQVVNFPIALQNSMSASAIHHHHHQQQQQQQQHLRGKPELEVYRPPNVRMEGIVHGGGRNKLNAHAQEFTMAMSHHYPTENLLQLSKSGGNLHYTMNNRNAMQVHHQYGGQRGQHHNNKGDKKGIPGAHLPSSAMPLVTSPSMGNVLQPSVHRVKFAPEPQILHHNPQPTNKQGKHKANTNHHPHHQNQHINAQPTIVPGSIPLQRSKSLSSADTIARGLAGLGFALSADVKDIGTFSPEHQQLIDIAIQDPNQLNARELMDLASVALRRAVEARRYALPLSQLCFTIVAKERKETFLEALLNTCRQWYQEREKILGPATNSRNPSRPRFTAFMAFLTEMFCQLKRRQLQLRTECDGVPPPMVLLTVLLKCCEDCVRPSVRSLSEIECLFYVLTCIGRDLETHLSDQLDGLLASVRDAFLNSNASAPAIRRTLLQLIELQASRWQLPGNTVLYYYPSK